MMYLSIFSLFACLDGPKNSEHSNSGEGRWIFGDIEESLVPVAVIDAPSTATVGQEVRLNGSRSYDKLGRELAAFGWRL